MQIDMSNVPKRSDSPTQAQLLMGWTDDVVTIQNTFITHGRLLIALWKLTVITDSEYGIMCRDFQQDTFDKIRDGE